MTKDSKPHLFSECRFLNYGLSLDENGKQIFLFLQRAATAYAAHSVGQRSALHWHLHRTASSSPPFLPSHSTPFHHRKNHPTHITPAQFIIQNSSFIITRQPNSKFIIHHSKLKRSGLRECHPCRNFAPETQGRNTYETENRNPDPTAR